MLRYLATALLIWVAAPDLNNKSIVDEPVETAARQSIVSVQEIEEPQLTKYEVVQAVQPTQEEPKKKGCEAHRDEIAKYDWNVDLMVAIMKAESGCRTTAVGDNYPIRGLHAPSCGLFQIRTLGGRPSCEALKDPATNIAWAYRIYQGQGLGAWSVYSSGKYKAHL